MTHITVRLPDELARQAEESDVSQVFVAFRPVVTSAPALPR